MKLERKRTPHPVRWVLRDASERPLASGPAWPEREPQRIAVRASESTKPAPSRFEPVVREGDGRRRVFVIINDCEDWRVLQYLRERREMPVHDELLRRGYRAVLTSTPAFTGAAMESLVWPTRGRSVSFVGLANRLGIELEGLSSVDRNPLEFLQPLLPEGENLFERVGAENHVAANFLFSHGNIDAGRNAELIGPAGKRRPASKVHALRSLRPDEAVDLPAAISNQHKYRAEDQQRYRQEVEKIAAELDTALALARDGEIDFLVLRVEPLDILTHALFTEMLRPGQDDGSAALLWPYRYIDGRLGEIWNALDADDVFIVMSDHGIRTGMEHEEDAIFVAVGGNLPRARVDGSPHLRGVASFLAGLFW
ncbi:MAG: alkaline phosphatase family protein, partial [Myxococcota bacterium]